jgi:hypothetical protein
MSTVAPARTHTLLHQRLFLVSGVLVMLAPILGFLLMRRGTATPSVDHHPFLWPIGLPLAMVGLYGAPYWCTRAWHSLWRHRVSPLALPIRAQVLLYVLSGVILLGASRIMWVAAIRMSQ